MIGCELEDINPERLPNRSYVLIPCLCLPERRGVIRPSICGRGLVAYRVRLGTQQGINFRLFLLFVLLVVGCFILS